MSAQPAKKQKRLNEGSSSRDFQEWWRKRFGMIKKSDRALCVLCSKSVVCRTSSIKQHYETVHKLLCDKSEARTKRTHFSKINNRKCSQMF
jgi:hypothetical protein